MAWPFDTHHDSQRACNCQTSVGCPTTRGDDAATRPRGLRETKWRARPRFLPVLGSLPCMNSNARGCSDM